MRKDSHPIRSPHWQRGMAGPDRDRLVAEAIAKAGMIEHERIARRLRRASPEDAVVLIEAAKRELAQMRLAGLAPREDLDWWDATLEQSIEDIAQSITSDLGSRGGPLRLASPLRRSQHGGPAPAR
ncbi:MAG: hypothetical protein ABSF50_16110 [Burkholderiaceae bacterium]|jgi:hypothetical protein